MVESGTAFFTAIYSMDSAHSKSGMLVSSPNANISEKRLTWVRIVHPVMLKSRADSSGHSIEI